MIESPRAAIPAFYPNRLAIFLCVCANILFLAASPVAFFASTVQKSKTPAEDDSPYYGLLYFCSFGTAAFSIIVIAGVSKVFYKLVESPVESGEQHSRYNRVWNAFVLSVITTLVFVAASGYLGFLWGGGAQYFGGFGVTSLLAFLAT
ncbi:uncharacterized protein A1O9_04127 [Exophiala aquamarina CBS 119918]|uniref:Uncharacterized protein n=1 Tax=Exophiala aquamarina CBS 119918 TaxID=1182545 RepID=A0A072PJ31_9EURO|nr:uncharacterized protein A1O9_04127 [Exophiala aquamarina CBS 119918]KEF59283.1 hypothetical protein A1O9_04127 [Exophiala aquamarina CBS 119918]